MPSEKQNKAARDALLDVGILLTHEDMQAALTAAEQGEPAPAARSGAVKVKALEWVQNSANIENSLWANVQAIDRSYTIDPASNVFHVATHLSLSEWGPDELGLFPTLEAAKTAAQADYERRILAALEPAEPATDATPVKLTYRNWRGEVSDRTITPKRVWFGSTEWHPEPQWMLTAFDHDKAADRDFALRDFTRPPESRLREEMLQAADQIERIAFAIPAPNSYTPQLAALAIAMRTAAHAQGADDERS